jgi:hypothetical protein
MQTHWRVLCSFIVLASSVTAAFGQAQIGSLLFGTVTDAHGAAVPGARVTFTVPATGAFRSVVTAEDGRYLFQQILAGVYDISVTKEGFKTARQSGIEVRVNESVRADIPIKVGAVTATIEVQATAALTDTYTAQLSTTVEMRRGNVGCNTLRGPGLGNMDVMVGKMFPIREQVRLQFRSEFFNAFNRLNLANPVDDVDSGAFGQIQSTVTGRRILQFGLKLQF